MENIFANSTITGEKRKRSRCSTKSDTISLIENMKAMIDNNKRKATPAQMRYLETSGFDVEEWEPVEQDEEIHVQILDDNDIFDMNNMLEEINEFEEEDEADQTEESEEEEYNDIESTIYDQQGKNKLIL